MILTVSVNGCLIEHMHIGITNYEEKMMLDIIQKGFMGKYVLISANYRIFDFERLFGDVYSANGNLIHWERNDICYS